MSQTNNSKTTDKNKNQETKNTTSEGTSKNDSSTSEVADFSAYDVSIKRFESNPKVILWGAWWLLPEFLIVSREMMLDFLESTPVGTLEKIAEMVVQQGEKQEKGKSPGGLRPDRTFYIFLLPKKSQDVITEDVTQEIEGQEPVVIIPKDEVIFEKKGVAFVYSKDASVGILGVEGESGASVSIRKLQQSLFYGAQDVVDEKRVGTHPIPPGVFQDSEYEKTLNVHIISQWPAAKVYNGLTTLSLKQDEDWSLEECLPRKFKAKFVQLHVVVPRQTLEELKKPFETTPGASELKKRTEFYHYFKSVAYSPDLPLNEKLEILESEFGLSDLIGKDLEMMGNYEQELSDLNNENRNLSSTNRNLENQVDQLKNEKQQWNQDRQDLDAFLQKRFGMDLNAALKEARTSS